MLVSKINFSQSEEEHCLVQQYGYLMSMKDLANLLGRPVKSIRATISTKKDEFSLGLYSAKFRLGRKVYFKTTDIAKLIDGYRHVE